MAIVIPAIVDAQVLALRESVLPHEDGATFTSAARPGMYMLGGRLADVLELLTGLIDATGLTVQGIHGLADAADQDATAPATDPGTGQALANALKAAYNLHRAKVAGNVHWAADAVNVVTEGPAVDEASTVAVANDLKTQFNAHILRLTGNCHRFADSKETITSPVATDYASAYVLLNEIQTKYNLHCVDIGCSTGALADTGAFTGANSMIGAKVTFTGNITAALAGVSVCVATNTVNQLNFVGALNALAATPKTGDTYAVEYSVIDSDINQLRRNKGKGDSASDPYGPGPSGINAFMKLLTFLGVAVPSQISKVSAEPFHVGSPILGGTVYGNGGGAIVAYGLQLVRDAVEAYTKPA